jgi:hypothetical protein
MKWRVVSLPYLIFQHLLCDPATAADYSCAQYRLQPLWQENPENDPLENVPRLSFFSCYRTAGGLLYWY